MAVDAGRPSIFTEELANEIITRISGGESMRKICESEGMPHRITLIRWLADPERLDFATRCARAREAQADVMDDLVLDTAHGVLAGTIDPNAGKVAISAYQWRASKLQPKRFGEAQLLKHADADGNVLKVEVTRVNARKQRVIDVTPIKKDAPALDAAPGDPEG